MESKLKYLEMIQAIISRQANNCFSVKGWCVTLVVALFALATSSDDTRFAIIALFPVCMFWMLDGYFLWQERSFRDLYNSVCKLDPNEIDFLMDTRPLRNNYNTLKKAVLSLTTMIFYGTVLIAIVMAIILL